MHEAAQFIIKQGYIVLFLWMLFEQLGLPIPAVPVLLAAGALAGIGKLNIALVFGLSLLAVLLGDQIWYQIGLRRGSGVLPFLCRLSLDPDSCVRHTKRTFARYGPRSLLVAKFIPGMATLAAPLAGIFHMRLARFLVFEGLGALLWTSLFIWLGFQFGHEIERHASLLLAGRISRWAGLVALAALGAYLLRRYLRRRRLLRELAVARITPEELKERLDQGEKIFIVDLRAAVEFEIEPRTIPGALRLSPEELEENHHKIPRDREIVLFCT
jgi:membrane protein DedA with SNARE-associated domain